MKELILTIAKALVDKPDEVRVTERKKDRLTVLELHVAPGDMGKVIGRQGRIAKAIRNVLKAYAIKNNVHVVLDIMDN
ncbi:MAG: KH domain-containing protein [Eubacteriaceae bacterium]|nr:KH domain-containing protein [Eubacteriaceae bacterium]MBQ1465253.1 KH domain-containing protein [Eubacteriaceae bacterium]MCR4894884.1 KH domain-containing protein [Eubacteriales bacterium]